MLLLCVCVYMCGERSTSSVVGNVLFSFSNLCVCVYFYDKHFRLTLDTQT